MPKSVGIIVYEYETDIEHEFPTQRAAAAFCGVGVWAIRGAIFNKKHYPQVLEEKGYGVAPLEDEYEQVRPHTPKTVKHNGRNGTPILCLHLYTHEVLKRYDKVVDAAREIAQGRDEKNIAINILKCCRGKTHQAYGYKWEYVGGTPV